MKSGTPFLALLEKDVLSKCIAASRPFSLAFPTGSIQRTFSNCKPFSIRIHRPSHSYLMGLLHRSRLHSPDSPFATHNIRALRTDSTMPPPGPKRISDSFCEVLLPFQQDAVLREEYLSIHGGLRFGKILEDLDAMAASIAYLHCDDADITLVTAAVDRIKVLKSFGEVTDVRLRGFVTYVGRSSMEVTMAVELSENDSWELAALAKFVFVARSQDGKSAIPVNRLVLETEREKEIFGLGEARHEERRKRVETSLLKQPPTGEESQLLHNLLMTPCSGVTKLPMRQTEVSSLRVCHPQERNIHNFMFGGYLMREAFELAYSSAILFTKGEPVTVTSVAEGSFVHSVPIGSLLNFVSRIVYTQRSGVNGESSDIYGQLIHTEVIADVIDPKNGTRVTTNTFHFTFSSEIHTADVVPETYTEAMKYLEGKRRVALE